MHAIEGPEARRMLDALIDAWAAASEREYELEFTCTRPDGSSAQHATMAVGQHGAPVARLRMRHDFATAESAWDGIALDPTGYRTLKGKYD